MGLEAGIPWLKHVVKRRSCQSHVNRLLLTFPQLYALLRYESQLSKDQIAVLHTILGRGISGNVIECGAYRGGTTVFMARYLKKHQMKKKIYVLDSFAGFNVEGIEEEIRRGLVVAQGRSAFTFTSADYVQSKIAKLGLDDLIEIVPGYFEETLQHISDSFSLGLIDCDLEKSTEFCLAMLWEKIVPNGCIVVDDYTNPGYPGARIASDRFLRSITCKHSEVRHGLLIIEK